MSKYVGRPRLYKSESQWNVGGDYDYYGEILFKLKAPGKLTIFGKEYKITGIVVFDGDYAWRSCGYLTNDGEYLTAPVPTDVLEEMLVLAETAVNGRGKLQDESFAGRIEDMLSERKRNKS